MTSYGSLSQIINTLLFLIKPTN